MPVWGGHSCPPPLKGLTSATVPNRRVPHFSRALCARSGIPRAPRAWDFHCGCPRSRRFCETWELPAVTITVSPAHHPSRCRNQNPRSRYQQTEVPEQPPPREQRDRRNHQGNLQEHFAQIEAVSLAAGKFGFVFHFVGRFVEFFLLIFIA